MYNLCNFVTLLFFIYCWCDCVHLIAPQKIVANSIIGDMIGQSYKSVVPRIPIRIAPLSLSAPKLLLTGLKSSNLFMCYSWPSSREEELKNVNICVRLPSSRALITDLQKKSFFTSSSHYKVCSSALKIYDPIYILTCLFWG